MRDKLEKLEGVVESARILGKDMWGKAVVRTADGRRHNVIGSMLGLEAGESVVCAGDWAIHPRFGEQFKASSIEAVKAKTPAGTIAWLSKRLPHIGKARAEEMVARWGVDDLWDVLENDLGALSVIRGIRPQEIRAIGLAYQAHRAERRRMVALRDMGLTDAQAGAATEAYGRDRVVEKVRANPYDLIERVRGIGFLRADKIARACGLDFDSPHRIRAGVNQALKDAAELGHTYVPLGKLNAIAARLLRLSKDDVKAEIFAMRRESLLEGDKGRGQLANLRNAERSIARNVTRMVA